ncbi:3-deoxy-manno-octulosonate cytidylyltransferase, partial [Myxococcota bacterium]|nr:3-deoxy-manno-octulosonate cytidylyltransferase [Myxococcota bacterium]
MKTAVIIPSRYASTRLPGKPLLEIGGKAMILRVLEQAQKSQADFVAVATDDERIFELIKESGGEVFMTREDHPSGSDRIAEVAEQIDANFIVNVQGDEPFISPSVIDELVLALQESGADIATMCTTIKDAALVTDPNAVKVVCTDQGDALYFSRAPIPFDRHQKG